MTLDPYPQKTFLFGATSIIGWNLFLKDQNKELLPFCNPFTKIKSTKNWNKICLENRNDYELLFKNYSPLTLIHCGGICDVDNCETDPEWAHKINVQGIEHLLHFLPKKTRLIYVSSDHVFGHGTQAFNENSKTCPISVYGKTRVLAEQFILQRKNSLILRVGLPIGDSADKRTGHLNWLQHRRKNNLPTTIVQDEFRSAVWANDLANRIMEYAQSSMDGIRHITATQVVSRLNLAEFLNKKFKIKAQLEMIQRAQKNTPHLGRVELSTLFTDSYAQALPSLLPINPTT